MSPDGAHDSSGRSREARKPLRRARRWIRSTAALLLMTGGATLLWAATDAQYEAAAGIDRALKRKPPTLMTDGDIEGKTFEVDRAFGQQGCKAKYEFLIAKSGIYPYPASGMAAKGIYVKIRTTFDQTKCEQRCERVQILQVIREYTKDRNGRKRSVAPDTNMRVERSGWNNPSSPSRGWFVDTPNNGPVFGPGLAQGSAEDGSTDTPLIERDAPGHYDGTKEKGKDLIACAVCVDARDNRRIIGCVNFGYYIDAAGNVAFDPKPPRTSGTAPQQVKDAVKRFEQITKNPTKIQF